MSLTKGKNVIIKENVFIGENVIIEDDVFIDYGVIIRDNVHIKKGSFIGARCILGEYVMDFFKDRVNKLHTLVIGENSLIRSETIIYGNCYIGENLQTGHRVTIREESKIGKNVKIGTNSDIQGRCSIGDFTSIHSDCFICEYTKIHNYVWIFPKVTITNDATPPSNKLLGVTINDFAIICAGSILLPGIVIGENSIVGAASVVSKNVKNEEVVIGHPAKFKCKINEIVDRNTGKEAYPWMNNFDRGMPWEGIGFNEWRKNLEELYF